MKAAIRAVMDTIRGREPALSDGLPDALFTATPRQPLGFAHSVQRALAFDVPQGSGSGLLRLSVDARAPVDAPPDAEPLRGPERGITAFYLFDAQDVEGLGEGNPALGNALVKYSAHTEGGKTDLVFRLPPTLPDSVVVYSYVNRNCPWATACLELEIITADIHARLVPEAPWRVEPTSLHKHWAQDGDRLLLTWLGRTRYMIMPEGFRLDDVPPATLRLVELLLFDNLEREAFGTELAKVFGGFEAFTDDVTFETITPTNIMLCYSGGEDSTAALAVLPEDSTTPVYIDRPFTSYRMAGGARIQLGERLFEARAVDTTARTRTLVKLTTDFEKLSLDVGQRFGFRDGIGYAAGAALVAHMFDANVVALGPPLGVTTLSGGHTVRDNFNNLRGSYSRQLAMFASASLILSYPIGVLSEVQTNRIAGLVADRYPSVPCPNASPEGVPCGACFKCFRKGMLSGLPVDPDPATVALLERRPLPMASCVVYASQAAGYTDHGLDEFADVDVELLERYYTTGLQYFVPRGLRERVAEGFARFGIEPMTATDEARLWSLYKDIGDPDAKLPAKFAPRRAYPVLPD